MVLTLLLIACGGPATEQLSADAPTPREAGAHPTPAPAATGVMGEVAGVLVDPGASTVDVGALAPLDAAWVALPPAPMAPRWEAESVTTDRGVLVVGGQAASGAPVTAATCDPQPAMTDSDGTVLHDLCLRELEAGSVAADGGARFDGTTWHPLAADDGPPFLGVDGRLRQVPADDAPPMAHEGHLMLVDEHVVAIGWERRGECGGFGHLIAQARPLQEDDRSAWRSVAWPAEPNPRAARARRGGAGRALPRRRM